MSYNRRDEKTVGVSVSLAGGNAVRKLGSQEDGFVLNKVVLQLTTKHTADATITVKKNTDTLTIDSGAWANASAAVGDDLVVTLLDSDGYPTGVTFEPGDKLTVSSAGGTTGVANVYAVGGIVPK